MVPEGWKEVRLKEIVDVTMGSSPKSSAYNTNKIGLPLLQGNADLKNRRSEPRLFTSEITRKCYAGDILLSVRAPVGSVAISQHEACIGRGLSALQAKPQVVKGFIYQLMIWLEPKWVNLSQGSTFEAINSSDIKALNVYVPQEKEQQKIAQILSTWDQAITTTQKLIETCRQQKQALMQQLLTGKVRFPGHKSEWNKFHIADVAKVIVSPVDKKSKDTEYPVYLCNYKDVYYNKLINKSLKLMRATATESEIKKYKLQPGDIVITKDSETPGDIAIPALIGKDLKNVICGYHLAIIRPDQGVVESTFLNNLFSTPQARYYFFKLANGATRFGLSLGSIKSANFYFPPLNEQQKIASALTTADKEIELLEQKLDYFKQEKKALMQQLLTGKRRVKT